jgi:predicted nucleic-acid-binding protein
MIGVDTSLLVTILTDDDPQAISWYESNLDFADALHLASSKRCETFATFDRAFIKKAQRFSSTEMITP